MIYTGEEGLAAIMFPVQEVDVFAETEPGRRDRISGKKAIINTDTRRVLSVVGRRYELLENRRALELAHKCCIAAFPNTAPDGWYVDAVEAPATGGHCRIDLHYAGDILTYDWSFSEAAQDSYYPYVDARKWASTDSDRVGGSLVRYCRMSGLLMQPIFCRGPVWCS